MTTLVDRTIHFNITFLFLKISTPLESYPEHPLSIIALHRTTVLTYSAVQCDILRPPSFFEYAFFSYDIFFIALSLELSIFVYEFFTLPCFSSQ